MVGTKGHSGGARPNKAAHAKTPVALLVQVTAH